MKKIIVLAPYIRPAKKAGGPVKSVSAIVELLSAYAEVKVLTKAYDVGSSSIMDGVVPDSWISLPECNVHYSSGLFSVLRQMFSTGKREEVERVFYLNSFFAFDLSILFFALRRLGFVDASPKVILAPRGEFSQGALVLKSYKKKFFIAVSKALRLHSGITWHATSDEEAKDIRRVFGDDVDVGLAPNIVDVKVGLNTSDCDKNAGVLKLLFLSRISPKKNLGYALRVLNDVKSKVFFDIYGPKEDLDYWMQCEELIHRLPDNVRVRHMGPLDGDEVPAIMGLYHLFILPTLGENFCHAIAEALQCGCPVLVSDQTPWRGLAERGVGWDVPLSDSNRFAEVVGEVAGMDAESFGQMGLRIKGYISDKVRESDADRMTLRVFGFSNG